MKTRLKGQYNGKWPISFVCESKPLITVITAILNVWRLEELTALGIIWYTTKPHSRPKECILNNSGTYIFPYHEVIYAIQKVLILPQWISTNSQQHSIVVPHVIYLYFWLVNLFHEPTVPNASGGPAPVCDRSTWSLGPRMRLMAAAASNKKHLTIWFPRNSMKLIRLKHVISTKLVCLEFG